MALKLGAMNARNEGEQELRAVTDFLPELDQVLKEHGTPDAVEVHREIEGFAPPFYVSLFYRDPGRTLIYKGRPLLSFERLADINTVPRSIRRQVFSQGPMPPPWPITVPLTDAGAFGAPDLPSAPGPLNPTDFSSSYASTSNDIRTGIAEIQQGETFARASRAFSRLNPSASLPGFTWNLVVFRSPVDLAFSVPDGTIFLSDSLIKRLGDDELAAVIAHLLAHEAYGHDRTFWAEANLVEKTGVVTGLALLVIVAMALTGPAGGGGGRGKSRSWKNFTMYSREQEAEANWTACRYLAAINIPPDTLFDALLKLSIPSSESASETSMEHYRTSESDAFRHMHTADRGAADLGKMLDTGMIVEPQLSGRNGF